MAWTTTGKNISTRSLLWFGPLPFLISLYFKRHLFHIKIYCRSKIFSPSSCKLCCLPYCIYTCGNVGQERNGIDYFIIIVDLLTRGSDNNLKCNNFIVFIFFFFILRVWFWFAACSTSLTFVQSFLSFPVRF